MTAQPHIVQLTCPGARGDNCPGRFTSRTNEWTPEEKRQHLDSPFHKANVKHGAKP